MFSGIHRPKGFLESKQFPGNVSSREDRESNINLL